MTENQKNKGGRPPLEFDYEELKKLGMIQATDREVAAFFGCSERSVVSYRKKDKRFREALETGQQQGLISLRRAQFNAAVGGNVGMLIWLGKQLLGQKDKTEHSGDPNAPLIGVPNVTKREAEAIKAVLDEEF